MVRRNGRPKAGDRRCGILGTVVFAACLVGWWPTVSAQPAADSVTILVYDASGSMWGQLPGGATKVEVAREVIGEFFASRDNTIPLGVVAYGHNRRGDCSDIEVVAPVAVHDAGTLSARLNRINPVGMTPLTDALQRAVGEIPATAEAADIILVTDGLETCNADPCALAARLVAEGIRIRAHVVGFGLTDEQAAAMSCVTDATGGLLLTPQSGQDLADALNRIAEVQPAATPTPEIEEAFFDIGPHAEAGHTYRIGYQGAVPADYYVGFARRGEGKPAVGAFFGVVGGAGEAGNNPVSRAAPSQPGDYDLIMVAHDGSIIARQAIVVVPPSNGFEAIGSVEPGERFVFRWRGPDQVSQRIVIAQPGDPAGTYQGDWGYALHRGGEMRLRAPADPGTYELRYLSANRAEILFSRGFGVGVPFQDADRIDKADLAKQAAAATRAAPGQDALPLVRATFRIPDGFPQSLLSWSAVPLDPDMSPEAWAPVTDLVVAEGEFEPGRYEVSALAPGEVAFKGVVEIVPGQSNAFEIPLHTDQVAPGDADGFAEPVAVACSGQPAGCPYSDPETGLTLLIPDGWSMTLPYFHRTAAGVAADVASASLFHKYVEGVLVIELNPRQWPAVRGECVEFGAHRICHGEADLDVVRAAVATLGRSLG